MPDRLLLEGSATDGYLLEDDSGVLLLDFASCYRDTIMGMSGLIGYWRMGDRAGTVMTDALNLNPGSYVNGPTLGVAGALSGDSDTAVSFASASNQYGSVPHHASLNQGNGGLSWVLSVKQVNTGATYCLVDKGGGTVGTGSPQIRLNQNLSGDIEWRSAGNVVYAHTPALITDALNHQIICTKEAGDGGNAFIYLDGVDVTIHDAVGFMVNNTAALNFGRVDNGTFYLNGTLDEVAAFTVALTPVQVATLWAAATVSCRPVPYVNPMPPFIAQ